MYMASMLRQAQRSTIKVNSTSTELKQINLVVEAKRERLTRVLSVGISFKDLHHRCKGAAIYQAEIDVHFPELTLGQTLDFAADARACTSYGISKTQATRDDDPRTEPHSSSQLCAEIFGLSASTN